ncbi:MAG: fatty acid desaturase [Bacteriovoracaceae bacterium]|nr:fatty acid desaturase [Bacteriovoracaceae bacterium]
MDANKNNMTKDWKKTVRPYMVADNMRSWWQVANTLIPYFITWYLAYKSLEISYALTLFFCLLNAGMMVRTFCIMHDCGHGSFFKSKKLRTIVGYITGFLTFTPYWQWTDDHAAHHQTSGDLDRRGRGDIWTLTAAEYSALSWQKKIGYKLYRNTFVTFIIGPIYLFQLRFRFTDKRDNANARRSVYICNIALTLIIGALVYAIGWKAFLMIQIPATMIAQFTGTWLFYVQHQYEDVYWERHEDWDYFNAAMEGCSYFKMNKVMQWFTANIGIHHLHHLSHLIPNYKLQQCMDENEEFQNPSVVTWTDCWRTAFLKIYDEDKNEMITFSEYNKRYRAKLFSFLHEEPFVTGMAESVGK